MSAYVFAALLATVVGAASACSSDTIEGPKAIAGPESLTVELTASSTTIDPGNLIVLSATARNESDAYVVARYAAQACGLQVIVETAAGAPAISSGQTCLSTAGEKSDTLPPSRSIGLDATFGNLAPGTYRAHAVFRAANGIAPSSLFTTLTVR